MLTILQAKQALNKTQLDISDITVLCKIKFISRLETEDTNPVLKDFKMQVDNVLMYYNWKSDSDKNLKSFGLDVKGSDDFLKNFYNWYTQVPNAKESLCMGFVKALVARQNNNSAEASKKVVAFCQAMKSK